MPLDCVLSLIAAIVVAAWRQSKSAIAIKSGSARVIYSMTGYAALRKSLRSVRSASKSGPSTTATWTSFRLPDECARSSRACARSWLRG